MSKNPPKPNTSPDHVKETAEAFTCPSHTEARERLEAEVAAIPADVTADTLWLIALDVSDWRTLLATPAQEGVGREEIARLSETQLFDAISAAVDLPNERAGELGISTAAFRAAISLLPAPKPGEGMVLVPREPTQAMLKAGLIVAANMHSNNSYGALPIYKAMIAAAPRSPQPAPGAPEGWREQCDWLCESSYRAGAKVGYNLGLGEDGAGLQKLLAAHHYHRAALTSSSAKLVDEEADEIEALNAYVKNLQAANRRLREGLEIAATQVGNIAFNMGKAPVEPDEIKSALKNIIATIDAALKDNGHAGGGPNDATV